ncbi:Panacea domain-containing protein [Companilactobacillus nodensis]|uniref:Antitoxin SocA-like Panacea domain-containing protein n=1 Tax=Companilactobacillus nodensis DSM 19682 = JCM 14932 = NBRC 107160 TaxID=1423775 RepID=A0A0R1KC51_9LACO|nr:type II toxin-antitoxin system antitoxin SocA domain-containing protein [Companilactobacillus nodensis]KRK81125.1 hypothetical protein FD03_GL000717 [Companilactobacillus nodensis DSM 19682 = JCM 14932 = NBRC 107160]
MINAVKTYSVFEVADWFLNKEAMQPKKLQKLVYYVQAWGNALLDTTIINNTNFEAWASGPISPEMRDKYFEYGSNDIELNDNLIIIENKKVSNLLNSVWVTYGDKDYIELEALSKSEYPWKQARGMLKEGERSSNVILNEDMKEFYTSIYMEG